MTAQPAIPAKNRTSKPRMIPISMWVSIDQQDYTLTGRPGRSPRRSLADFSPDLLHNVKYYWTPILTDSSLTKHGWIVALTILIGAGSTAAGVGLQIREFLKRKRR
jgi:hypothetical protein